MRDILSYKISEMQFLLLYCWLKQIAIFGPFDDLKMH